jgi:hypothetical protein
MSLKTLIQDAFPEIDPQRLDRFIETIHNDMMGNLGVHLKGNSEFAAVEEYLFDIPDWTKIDRQSRIEDGL